MRDYLVGMALAACTIALLVINQPVWAMLPAVAAIIVLGKVLTRL